MSFVGHVDCQRIVIGPVCPFEIIGKPSVAPPATTAVALFRDFRRVTDAGGASGVAGMSAFCFMRPPRVMASIASCRGWRYFWNPFDYVAACTCAPCARCGGDGLLFSFPEQGHPKQFAAQAQPYVASVRRSRNACAS